MGLYLVIVCVLIDRACTRLRINSTPYQFGAIGLAGAAEIGVFVTIEQVFPFGSKLPFNMDRETGASLTFVLAGIAGFGCSMLVWILLRSKQMSDEDYDDSPSVRRPKQSGRCDRYDDSD